MLGNAFHVRHEAGNLTYYFDQSHANLIPMLKTADHYRMLRELATKYFHDSGDIHFAVGRDPRVKQQQDREAQAMEAVMANPKIQFILDQFKGTIINCQILDDPKE